MRRVSPASKPNGRSSGTTTALVDEVIRQSTLASVRSYMASIADAIEIADLAAAGRDAEFFKEELAAITTSEREQVLGDVKRWLVKFDPSMQGLLCSLLGLERPEPIGQESDVTDTANGHRLVFRYSGKLRYVGAWGWLVWNGQRWRIDDTNEVYQFAKESARSIYEEARTAPTDNDAKRLAAWAKASLFRPRMEAMLSMAKSEPAIAARQNVFDQNPWLLNVNNGTIDLRTGELREHSQDDHLTKLAPVDYMPDARSDLWIEFLHTIFGSDGPTLDFVQRAVGYTLTGDTSEQCLFLCHGKGANGKSTFLETLRAMLGDYGQQAGFSTFLARQNEDGPRNDIARMIGARFVAAIEMGDGGKMNEPMVKQMTGGDTLTARYLHKEFFEFRPAFKVWLAANHKPKINDNGHAMWRRIRLISFSVTIPEQERDKHLAEKLRAELPGVLAWAVRGCLAWQQEGLGLPETVRAATDEYRDEMDTLAQFLNECCVQRDGAIEKVTPLLEAYKSFSGDSKISAKEFKYLMVERGFQAPRHTKHGNVWDGIGLIDLLQGEG